MVDVTLLDLLYVVLIFVVTTQKVKFTEAGTGNRPVP
jgi:hypothetical protein